MRERNKPPRKRACRPRRRRRSFMIDAEEFDFMDELEVEDWMISQVTNGTE